MPLAPDTRLGPYVILAPLGAGGMGEVYRARDSRLDRDVAVKVLARDQSGDEEMLRRFKNEAQSAALQVIDLEAQQFGEEKDFVRHRESPEFIRCKQGARKDSRLKRSA